MNRTVSLLGMLSISIFGFLAYLAHTLVPGYWQDLALGLATTFLGLGIGVLAVNAYLSSADKRQFAKPLLKMIAPQVEELHNELVIQHGINTFGKNDFERILEVYKKHKGDPQAFSPQQRDALYAAIELIKPDLIRVHDILTEQLRELTMLLGWSFDSRVTSAALSARLSFATFKAANWDGSDETKRVTIEAYLDSDAATGAVVHHLIAYLGVKESDWKRAS